jgi:hypothetical protein
MNSKETHVEVSVDKDKEEETIEEITKAEELAMEDETDEEIDEPEKDKVWKWSVEEEEQETGVVSRLPVLVQYIVYVLIGWAVLALPGLISFFLYTERVTETRTNPFLDFSALNFTASNDVVFDAYVAKGFSIEGYPAWFYCTFLGKIHC